MLFVVDDLRPRKLSACSGLVGVVDTKPLLCAQTVWDVHAADKVSCCDTWDEKAGFGRIAETDKFALGVGP